jgi:hypothetical protein
VWQGLRLLLPPQHTHAPCPFSLQTKGAISPPVPENSFLTNLAVVPLGSAKADFSVLEELVGKTVSSHNTAVLGIVLTISSCSLKISPMH